MIRINDFDALVCGPDLPIREVLARINDSESFLFQIVVDAAGRVVGTVTDGDIRRAMLRGVTLEDRARACMHRAPVTGRVGEAAANRAKLARMRFLPAVDSAGRLVEVLVAGRAAAAIGQALVMAGGFGTRLGERTRDLPKPLVAVGDRPILDRVLGQLEEAGVERIYVAVHFLAEKIEAFLGARRNRAAIEIIREARPLGTAGALGRLPGPPESDILVVNADVLNRVDVNALKEFHLTHNYDGTIAVSRYDVRIPFGVLHHSDDGVFAGIDEKPTLHHFIAAGLYYLSPGMVRMVPAGRAVDMPELLEIGRAAGLRIGLFPVHEYWIDVGAPDDLATANADHARAGAKRRSDEG